MARKTLDTQEIAKVRGTWISNFDTAISKSLEKLEAQAKEIEKSSKTISQGFYESDYVSYKVGSRVLKYIQLGKQRSALITVHTAINEAQRVSSFFRMVAYPSIIDIQNDAIFVYNKTLSRFKADEDVNYLFSTNAEIEREASFVCISAERYVDKISTYKEQLDNYLKFVDEQMFSLSRLDTLLRTNEKMLYSESFSRAGDDFFGVTAEDEEGEDEEGEDENQALYVIRHRKDKINIRTTADLNEALKYNPEYKGYYIIDTTTGNALYKSNENNGWDKIESEDG